MFKWLWIVSAAIYVQPTLAAEISKDTLFEDISSSHSPVSYNRARELLFGFLYLEGSSQQTYSLDIYYCNQKLTNKDFAKANQLAPMQIPDNNVVNVEHAWPQSHFTGQFSKSFQKADLHILFPTLSHINSIRGNFPYGEVVEVKQSPCTQAALGLNAQGEQVFEPDDVIKGDMARATFYFSTRYKIKMDPVQEEVLRRWHKMDPPDSREIELNEQIDKIQKNRNPFIDHVDYVDQINDF
ncbi:endonuclease [bacterium]|nr:endonuclease [bacterium]